MRSSDNLPGSRARVTTNTRVADLNLQHLHRHDDRRIEVIANGLNLWGGAQLAIDATLVFPPSPGKGNPADMQAPFEGRRSTQLDRAKREHTQNCSTPDGASSSSWR